MGAGGATREGGQGLGARLGHHRRGEGPGILGGRLGGLGVVVGPVGELVGPGGPPGALTRVRGATGAQGAIAGDVELVSTRHHPEQLLVCFVLVQFSDGFHILYNHILYFRVFLSKHFLSLHDIGPHF